MGYATLTDAANFGLTPGAYGMNITAVQIQANLDARSAWADTRLRGRYEMSPLPPPYDPALVRAVVHMARYDILSLRGFDETNASDKNVIEAKNEAEKLLNDVQREFAHLAVNVSTPGQEFSDPLITSQTPQGWIPNVNNPVCPDPSGIN